ALAENREPLAGLGHGDELDGNAGGGAATDLAFELLGVTVGPRDLEGAALGEAERLTRLLRERGELAHRALGQLGERGGRANLAREPGRPGRGLGGESGPLQYSHTRAAAGEVVRRAGAEGAGADDHDVGGVDHQPDLTSFTVSRSSRH